MPNAGEIEARPAETSEKPADFANASPFPNRRDEVDVVATMVLGVAALAIVAFLVSMLGLLQIHGPRVVRTSGWRDLQVQAERLLR